jgi:hypothetical protein
VAFALLLGGCFFEAPLDPAPQGALDARLLGRWRCVSFEPGGSSDDADAGSAIVTIAAADRAGVDVVTIEHDRYEIHGSPLGADTVLNVRELGDTSSKPWLLVRHRFLQPNVVLFQLVDHEKVKPAGASPAAVREAVEAAARAGEIFGDWLVCARPKPE